MRYRAQGHGYIIQLAIGEEIGSSLIEFGAGKDRGRALLGYRRRAGNRAGLVRYRAEGLPQEDPRGRMGDRIADRKPRPNRRRPDPAYPRCLFRRGLPDVRRPCLQPGLRRYRGDISCTSSRGTYPAVRRANGAQAPGPVKPVHGSDGLLAARAAERARSDS